MPDSLRHERLRDRVDVNGDELDLDAAAGDRLEGTSTKVGQYDDHRRLGGLFDRLQKGGSRLVDEMEFREDEHLTIGDLRRQLGELNDLARLFNRDRRALSLDDDEVGMGFLEHGRAYLALAAPSIRTDERGRKGSGRFALSGPGRTEEQKGVNW